LICSLTAHVNYLRVVGVTC